MTFSVTVVSLTQLTYQWYFNSSPISGATGASLALNDVTPKNAGSYSVTVVNAGGSANSSATLTVVDNPPTASNDSYTCTQNIALVVSAPGVLAKDTDPYGSTIYAGLMSKPSHGTVNLNTNGGFTYSPATNYYGADSFTYRATDGYVYSSAATVSLTILAPPAITNQPQSQGMANNTQATFSVGASGTPTLSYQWWYGGSAVSGATNSAYTFTAKNKNAGNYYVVVTNSWGSVTSAVATLTIGAAPNAVTLGASDVITNSAALNATVNCQGYASAYYFLYGSTTNYGLFSVTNNLSASTTNITVATLITNLNPGTAYHFCIAAESVNGISYGEDATFSTPYLAPTVATLAAAGVTTNAASLNASINPQGAAATYYFQYGTTTNYGLVTVTNALAAGATVSNVVVSVAGLNSGTVYHYSIVAANSGGLSAGEDAIFSTPYPAPSATTLAAASVTTNAASLNASINPQGAAVTYYFQYGTTTNYGLVTTTSNLAAGIAVSNVAVPIAGLDSGTVYHYSIVAANSGGVSGGSDATFATAYPLPKAVILSATNITMASATIKGRVNPEGTDTTYYFQFGRTTNYDSCSVTNTLTARTNGVAVSAPITGLAQTTVYHYCVVAINAGGTTVSADATFETAYPPPAATTMDVSSVTAGTATLHADINSQGTDTSYYFQYGVTTNYTLCSVTNSAGDDTDTLDVSAPISSLASGITYYYSVVAMSSGGTTLATNYGSFTTLVISQTSLNGTTIANNGQNHMQLSLTNAPGATFTVYSSPALIGAQANWSEIGTMTETVSGQYQFTDPQPATNASCFYSTQSN